MHIGQQVKEARIKLKLNQTELAEKSGCPSSLISRLEKQSTIGRKTKGINKLLSFLAISPSPEQLAKVRPMEWTPIPGLFYSADLAFQIAKEVEGSHGKPVVLKFFNGQQTSAGIPLIQIHKLKE